MHQQFDLRIKISYFIRFKGLQCCSGISIKDIISEKWHTGSVSLQVGSDDDDDDVYDIEKRREENLRDNAEFLARLGMSVARSHFIEAVAAKKKPSSKGYKEK